MSVQAYVGSITTPASTGTVTTTGIVDQFGAAFTPKVIIFLSSGCPLGFTTYEYVILGVDDGTTRWGNSVGARPYAEAGLNEKSGFQSSTYSIQFLAEGLSAETWIQANVSAIASGQFTVTYAQNLAGAGLVYGFLALGGSELQYAIGTFPVLTGGGPYSVTGLPFTPTCELFTLLAQAATAEDEWLGQPNFGWFVTPTQQGCSAIWDQTVSTPSWTTRYQSSTHCAAHFSAANANASSGTITGSLTGVSQDAAGFTVTGPADPDSGNWGYLALNLAAAAIVSPQPTLVGTQTLLAPGVSPVAAFALSVNGASSTAVQTNSRFSLGATDGTRQVNAWTGNNTAINPDNPSRMMSTSALVTAAVPASTVNAQASITSFMLGAISVTWNTVDSTARETLYLVLGPAGSPTPPTPTLRAIRRKRVFPLPYATNLWLYLSRLEIILQQGMGLISGQGAMPILMCRISRDGGMTFGPELQMGAGAIGQFQNRSYRNRLGRARNFVVELTCTDPIPWYLLDAIVDLEEGTT